MRIDTFYEISFGLYEDVYNDLIEYRNDVDIENINIREAIHNLPSSIENWVNSFAPIDDKLPKILAIVAFLKHEDGAIHIIKDFTYAVKSKDSDEYLAFKDKNGDLIQAGFGRQRDIGWVKLEQDNNYELFPFVALFDTITEAEEYSNPFSEVVEVRGLYENINKP